MDFIQKRAGVAVVVAFILGLLFGLPLLGWLLWPVQWTDATPAQLAPDFQQIYVESVAGLYAATNNADLVQQALTGWVDTSGNPVSGAAAACQYAALATDPAQQARLQAIATVVEPGGCAAIAQDGVQPEAEGGISWGIILLLLLLVGLIVAILYLFSRRNAAREPETSVTVRPTGRTAAYEEPEAAPGVTPVEEEDVTAIPLARFRTTYTQGNDAYDDSFSIENESGEFLGECGVGIAESIGTDMPRNVTAFEVWLFDKNDIRTITKVIMSDHAFFDEALKAKLAPKGEPVLARENETIVLETAALIINAEITDMAYGTDAQLPDRSYFTHFTIELSAWAKEINSLGSQSASSGADNVLEY